MKSLLFMLACLATPVIAAESHSPTSEVRTAMQAHRDGNPEEALRNVKLQFDRISTGANASWQDYSLTMFVWNLLIDDYPTARLAMINERDKQTRQLLEGDAVFFDGGFMPVTRLRVILEMNRSLKDSRSTYRLVTQLLSDNPALVGKEIHMALEPIVEAGDYALAVQYIENPLTRIEKLNQLARELPLFPPPGKAPHLSAELSNFMGDVILLGNALTGLGKSGEADELRAAALKGILSDELRDLATRELAVPGSIIKAITEHQMTVESGQR